ncbi:autotransporter outer membrane beta-barrel domain-containing protein [Erwinia psidii]|uniref:S6 family peptidase n=1 Tax=Erwinia psidii TaxID=69224 RepID=UPI00226B7357|nr:S6 family peptidase [Erwinia psidii]MCX8965681.1 autotransporter outer membrane beta-barrel domain-containing protein [Erwinia psidii]
MKKNAACYCTLFVCTASYAGIMRQDINLQDYRDFGENLGKYAVGNTDVDVYTTDGALAGTLNFPIPDFGVVVSLGYATLISPSYVAGVTHNGGYKTVTFGNNAKYSTSYTLINRNEEGSLDFHTPRLNKVVTETAAISYVTGEELRDTSRYIYYARVGTGTQKQVDAETQTVIQLSGAYNYRTGGTILSPDFSTNRLTWTTLSPDDPNVTALDIGAQGGDSGSPVLVYDNIDKIWKLAGVTATISGTYPYGLDTHSIYIQDAFIQQLIAANTDPDVTDSSNDGTIYWGASDITQGTNSWEWHGVDTLLPSEATNEALDASKDLRFNGDGGTLLLAQSVNMGAGKLQFSNNYQVISADGANSSWTGGGIDVDADKTVQWQVNGLAGDDLHKIGAGTLYVNATGINGGGLNTGDGTVVLDQQADADGNKQAFSSVTLVSGRPTVVLNDAEQVATEHIFFGYRGGKLDLNGNSLSFKQINHTDSGATLVNHNTTQAAILNLTGYSSADVSFQTFSESNPRGTVGSIYIYPNPYTKETEYFQLNESSYWYFPTDKSSTAIWTYLGTDASAAIDYRLAQLNQTVFRGFLGDSDSSGVLNVNVDTPGSSAITALTGGMDLKGNLAVSQGTVLLSGQPVPHAGGLVEDDDWATALFSANQIAVNEGSTLQVGEYAQVQADIVAGDSSQVMLGYNTSTSDTDKIWRCYSVINTDTTTCSQPVRSATELAALTASTVSGNITLGDNTSLYLGKVNYEGAISSTTTSTMTMNSGAYWQLTGNSSVSYLKALPGSTISLLAAEGTTWSPAELTVDSLDATGLSISLAASPANEQGDRVTIVNTATGSSNTLDISVLTTSDESVQLLNDIVLLDAPAGTAHDYFTVPSVASGFSLYTPDYRVIEKDDRVQWVLAHNAEAEPESPAESEDASIAETSPEAETPAESEDASVAETSPEPESPAESEDAGVAEIPAEAETPADPTDGKPSGWFTIRDNKPLVRHTRLLLASRQYVFSEAISQLHGRASLLRNSPEKSGDWVSVEHGKGRFEGFKVNQQSLNLGWDTVQGQQMFGFNAGYTEGKTKGNGQVTHHLASAGADYSWSSPAGWFIDTAARYMHLSQDLTFDPLLGIHHGKANSHILSGSVKSGYQFAVDQHSLFISTYIGLTGSHLSGYRLESNTAQVGLSSSTPYFATAGLEVKKGGLWRSNSDVMVTAGIEYQYSPGKAGSSLTLSDSQSRREFAALSDNRYRFHVGTEGKIADKWSLEMKARSSVGGTFRTDYSGIAGVNYRF